MITASCSDYRAGSIIDLEHDAADITTKVTCPLRALWAEHGIMTTLFDIPAEWRKRCTDVSAATVPGGHFVLDQQPEATARILGDFFARRTDRKSVVSGKSVTVSVDRGGRRSIKNKKKDQKK